MIYICEKVRLRQLGKSKVKYSTLASISHIFQKNFLTQPSTYLESERCNFFEKFFLSFFFEQDLHLCWDFFCRVGGGGGKISFEQCKEISSMSLSCHASLIDPLTMMLELNQC